MCVLISVQSLKYVVPRVYSDHCWPSMSGFLFVLISVQSLNFFVVRDYSECVFFHVTFCVSKILTFFVLRVYSEEQPGDAATALFIKQLSEEDAGQYR